MTAISRRSFLASTAALAAAPALGQVPSSGQVDVVIVGAGAAGIAAARRVAAAGRRFALIEASNRIGGRCVTDTRSFGAPFDRGAHWVRMPDVNPVVKAAAKANFEIYPALRSQKIRIGRRNARESELEEFLALHVRSIRSIADAARGKTDISCARALPKELGDWRPTIEFLLGPGDCAKELTEVSAQDFSKSADRDSAFCRQGYGTLLARAADGIPVQLSTPATAIEWDRRLEVQTPKGTITARAIIVTASTNVLTSGKIKFNPEIPKRQLDAAAKLRLGSYERIALDIPGNPFGLAGDDMVFEKAQNIRTAFMLANVTRSPLHFVDVGGRFGRELGAQGDKAMIAFAEEWLMALYGADIKKAVRSAQVTQWDKEPWVLGAWSSAAPGAQPARAALMEPLRDRVWFAGEAAHETLWGTVNGAWQSGERAAEAALRKMGALKEEPPLKRPPARR